MTKAHETAIKLRAEKKINNIDIGTTTIALTDFACHLVWQLYAQHKDDELITVNLWFVKKVIRVSIIRPKLVEWFGGPPPGVIA